MADVDYSALFHKSLRHNDAGQPPSQQGISSADVTPVPVRKGPPAPVGEVDPGQLPRQQTNQPRGEGTFPNVGRDRSQAQTPTGLGGVFSSPELTAPVTTRRTVDHSKDEVVNRKGDGDSWITAMGVLDYGAMGAAGFAGNRYGFNRVADRVNEAQGKLSQFAVKPELAAEFNSSQGVLHKALVARLSESDGTFTRMVTEHPDLLNKGPRFLYDSTGIDEATLNNLHRPLQLNSVIEAMDKVPAEKLTADQAGEAQKFFAQMSNDPIAIREGLSTDAATAANKAQALMEAQQNLTGNTGSPELRQAAALAEQEYGNSLRTLRVNAGGKLVTASEVASTVAEKHPEFVEEVERFKVDPSVTAEQRLAIERYRNLDELTTKVGRVKVPVTESTNTITNMGEHLGSLKALKTHPGIDAEGLSNEALRLETNANKVIAARGSFNAAMEKELTTFKGTNLKVFGGALATDLAIDSLLFNERSRGNKSILFDAGAAGLALFSRANPWVKYGAMVGAHVVGRYMDEANYKPKKK